MEIVKDYKVFLEKQKYLSELILNYSKILSELQDEAEAQYAKEISNRIKSENFEIAVVGSFKNGKSTFINALLGKEILPAYARPCTAIINEVKYGKNKSATVFLKDNLNDAQIAILPDWIKSNISNYNAEIGIVVPMNKLNEVLTIPFDEDLDEFDTPYSKMILYYPLDLLKNHVIITDTPGLNEFETRTRITTDHLSKADAIIMVFSADKLCSRVEMMFIEDNLRSNGFTSPLFVINRMDVLRNEREVNDIKKLAINKLKSYTQKGENGIFFVSAANVLDGITDEFEFSNFEKSLSQYLVNERGKEKLVSAAKLIYTKIKNDILLDIIPKKTDGLNMGLQDAIINQTKAQESLKKASDSKNKISKIINENVVIYIKSLEQIIEKGFNDIIDKVAIWIDSFTPNTYDELKQKDKVKVIQKDIKDYLSEKIKDYYDEWYKHTYKAALIQNIDMLNRLIKNDLTEFLKELKISQETFFTKEIQPYTEELNESTSFVNRFIEGELFKSIGKSLGVALGAGLLLEILTGLMNPILGVATAIGAIIVGFNNGSKKVIVKIKENLKDEMNKTMPNICNNASKKLCKEMHKIFEDYKNQIHTGLDRKYNKTKKEIDTIVETLQMNENEIQKRKNQLINLEKESSELMNKFRIFMDEL